MSERTCETCEYWEHWIGKLGQCTEPLNWGDMCVDMHADETCERHQPQPKDTDNDHHPQTR